MWLFKQIGQMKYSKSIPKSDRQIVSQFEAYSSPINELSLILCVHFTETFNNT